MEEKIISQKQEQIKELLKDLDLKAEKLPGEFIKKNKRFFYSPCLTREGSKVFIKVAIKKEQAVLNSLTKEAIATKLVGDLTNIKIPRYYDSDLDAEMPWFIHEYVEGESLGYFYELDKKYKSEKFINPLLENLKILQESSVHLLNSDKFFKELKKNDYQIYLKTFLRFEEYFYEKDFNFDFKAIVKLLEESKPLFLEEDIYVVAQGDFTLANNIVSQDNIYLTDWESIHINNFADDLGRLWIQTWLYPDWRKRLLLSFVDRIDKNKKEKFKQVFRIVSINQAFSEIGGGSKLCEKKFSRRVTNASLATIDKALEGFDSLLR